MGEEQPAAPPLPGARLLDLVAVMDTLRLDCPWDARQTHESLLPYLIEETYEAADAVAAGDLAALCGELGDVLLQVVFHARVAAERTDGTGFDIDDVADGIIAKLTRRHPHVFAGVEVSGPDQVSQNWDAIKAAERAAAGPGAPGSALDGVPMSQPALSLAAQLLRRASRAGVPAELAEPPATEPPSAELSGMDQAEAHPPGAVPPGGPAVSELGRELLALVNRAQAAGLDAELELRAAARAYAGRVREFEAKADSGAPS
jgi:MazG family protein